MSRSTPVFPLTILLLLEPAALAAASPAFAAAELRRLPIVFDQLARLEAGHRLFVHDLQVHHHSGHKVQHTEDKSERLARAANLLTVSGYADIKEVHTEGDHVAALVVENDETRTLIVTKDGAVAAGDTAATEPSTATPTASEPNSPAASASSASNASAPASEIPPPAPAADAASATTPAANKAQVQTAAAVGSTSEAARPGALSPSSSTP